MKRTVALRNSDNLVISTEICCKFNTVLVVVLEGLKEMTLVCCCIAFKMVSRSRMEVTIRASAIKRFWVLLYWFGSGMLVLRVILVVWVFVAVFLLVQSYWRLV